VTRPEGHTPSFRASALTFVLLLAGVVAGAAGLLVLLDPRAQQFWGIRWEEFLASVRALFGQ
jgi:hypothetical protein